MKAPPPADDIGDEDDLARHAEQNQANDVAFLTDREDGEDEPDIHCTTKLYYQEMCVDASYTGLVVLLATIVLMKRRHWIVFVVVPQKSLR